MSALRKFFRFVLLSIGVFAVAALAVRADLINTETEPGEHSYTAAFSFQAVNTGSSTYKIAFSNTFTLDNPNAVFTGISFNGVEITIAAALFAPGAAVPITVNGYHAQSEWQAVLKVNDGVLGIEPNSGTFTIDNNETFLVSSVEPTYGGAQSVSLSIESLAVSGDSVFVEFELLGTAFNDTSVPDGVRQATPSPSGSGTITLLYDVSSEATVPEPATLLILAAGLVGLRLARRNKRRYTTGSLNFAPPKR